MFLHSTARSADIQNTGNLAIIPQHKNMVRKFLVRKLSSVILMKLRQYTYNMLDNPQSVLLRRRWMNIAVTYGNEK